MTQFQEPEPPVIRTKRPSRKNLKILSQIILKFINELEKNDPNDIFAQPVTDQIAPGYSTMIRNPMDFSTIKTKTENLVYEVSFPIIIR